MKHLDTFSGIGGWALAAKWMGWETVAFVEKEKFCQKVLNKNFPGVPVHDDIFTFSGKSFRGAVDILTGSTPCQPFSQAGKREGSNDERHLFPEFLRVVAEVQPRWIVIENVYGLLSIESGQVFEDYHTSLEGEGYSVQTLCIPASALDARHRRNRLWIVAQSGSGRRNDRGDIRQERHIPADAGASPQDQSKWQGRERWTCQARPIHAHTDEPGSQGRDSTELPERSRQRATWSSRALDGDTATRRLPDWAGGEMGQPSPLTEFERSDGTRSRRPGRNGKEQEREIERDFCGISYGVSNRVDRLKSLGNAIVPQIAYEIFRAIEEVEILG